MSTFQDHVFDKVLCRRELDEFGQLLTSKPELDEAADVLPFFRDRKQLSSFIGTVSYAIGPADLIRHEFVVSTDFRADLALGNKARCHYAFIEFEDGTARSVFCTRRTKSGNVVREWSPRFEHGFSQLVDWMQASDENKTTGKYRHIFGPSQTAFTGILVAGRDATLDNRDRERIDWRTNKVVVDSNKIMFFTFDGLFAELQKKFDLYSKAFR